MAFKMIVSAEKIEGQDVMPSGQYEVKLLGFKPSLAKTGSINLNACMEVVNHPDYAGRKLYSSLNVGMAFMYPDFSHCFGIIIEGDGKNFWLPGTWDGDVAKFKEDDPTTWKYVGPLVGRIGKIEVAVTEYNGKERNDIRRYFWNTPGVESKWPKLKPKEDLLSKKN
jgi:hypothetical protein